MRKSSYYTIVTVFLLAGLATVTTVNKDSSQSLSSYMSSQGIDVNGGSNYTLQKKSTKDLNEYTISEISARSENHFLELKTVSGVNSEFAAEYLEQKHTKLSSIYSSTPAPYGAIPDRQPDCKGKNKLNFSTESENNYNQSIYEIFTDEEKNYACSKEEAKYQKRTLIMYCSETEMIIESNFYSPINSSNISQPDFKCKS